MKNILSLIVVLALTISVNAQTVLFLDAGHGGKDPGATSSSGITEAKINQLFVQEIKTLAEAKGIKVILLSDFKTYIPLKDRVKKANEYKLASGEKAMLVSIHASFDVNDPSKSGQEIYMMRESGRSAGSLELAKSFVLHLNVPVQEKGLTILREATMPAVLIETGFLSNEQDLMDLQTPDMRTLLIRKIVAAIE